MTAPSAASRAEALLAVGRPAAARDLLRSAGVVADGDPDPIFLLAHAHLHLAEWAHAQEVVEIGLHKDPTSAWGMRILAGALLRRGRPAAALSAAEESVRLAPTDALSFTMLALVLREQGDIEGARYAAQHAVQLDPMDEETHRGLGRAELAAGNDEQARVHFLDALRLQPEDAGALNDLGISEVNLARFDDAGRRFASSVAIDPAGPGAFNHGHTQLLIRRRWARLVSGIVNPVLGTQALRLWWRRTHEPRVAGLYGPLLWSGGIWQATARVGGTAFGWAAIAWWQVTGSTIGLPIGTWSFLLATTVAARLPARGAYAHLG